MTRRLHLRFRFDAGFLVVLVICLVAVWPLISRASLPEGTDAELHIFRLHELSLLIRGGEFYPRWAPNFYHGYGYPIFNYYAPLTYYLAVPFELLPAIDATAASKIVLVTGILLAGLGLYGYVRDNWGRRAGYVAAALYVYSPYIQYIDPHMRGALPEAFSFGLFPVALWALDRLRQRPGGGAWLAAVVSIAAVILSHNLMGLFFYGLLAAWVVWQGLLLWRQPAPVGNGRRPVFFRSAAALLLGLGLAAFFWLPVILEREAVTLSTLIGSGDNYDFRTHFLSLGELLAFSRMPDWGATQSPFVFNLGVAQWVMALVGVAMFALRRARQPAQLAFSVLVGIVVLFLMLPVAQPVWELLPFMAFFQFPWRLLGAAAALLAIVGAAGVEAIEAHLMQANDRSPSGLTDSGTGQRTPLARQTRAAWLYAAAVALPLILALPLSQPAPWASFGEVNTLRMSLIENSGRWLGTTSTADYVPATVITLPPRRSSVVDPIGQGLPPDRVNREAMPDGAVVVAETVRPLLTRYHVSAPKQFRLRLYQFDFPGWRVTVDGEPAVTELAEPEGFIVVLVPPGDHIVEVEFGSTPPRTLAWIVTTLSALLAGIGAWRLRTGPAGGAPESLAFAPPVRADWPVLLAAGGLTLLAIMTEPLDIFHANSQGRELDIPAVEHYVNFGDQIELLGFDTSREVAAPDDTIDLMLYWRAFRDLDIEYQVFVHILDGAGEPVAQSDKLNPGEFPTHRWPLDKYVPDAHSLVLPSDLPPGEYRVAVGLWVQSEGWRLPVFDEQGSAVADHAILFNLRVE